MARVFSPEKEPPIGPFVTLDYQATAMGGARLPETVRDFAQVCNANSTIHLIAKHEGNGTIQLVKDRFKIDHDLLTTVHLEPRQILLSSCEAAVASADSGVVGALSCTHRCAVHAPIVSILREQACELEGAVRTFASKGDPKGSLGKFMFLERQKRNAFAGLYVQYGFI